VCENLLAKWQPRVYYTAIPKTAAAHAKDTAAARAKHTAAAHPVTYKGYFMSIRYVCAAAHTYRLPDAKRYKQYELA
jgi:hypothetical protein